jgi:hypothetical protein
MPIPCLYRKAGIILLQLVLQEEGPVQGKDPLNEDTELTTA